MMQAYRNYPPANQPSPHATRRGPRPMVSHPGAPLAQTQIERQREEQLIKNKQEFAARQAKNPTDKNLPDGVDAVVIGDGVDRYMSLRETERRLDAIMMRKRVDLLETKNKNLKNERILRIWVSNTAENQPWQQNGMTNDTFDFNSNVNAKYKVKIEGRLLPDELEFDDEANKENETGALNGDAMETDGDDATSKPKTPLLPGQQTRFSHFFKKVTIEFDHNPALQADGDSTIDWTKPDPRQSVTSTDDKNINFDCLEFERSGDENVNVTINLHRDEHPDRYRLEEPLANLLDTDEADRAGAVMGIWEYVKSQNLQEDEENRIVHCDDRLKAVFGKDTLFFPHIPHDILAHMTPLPPLQIPYTIRVDQTYINSPKPTIYDITVPVPSPLRLATAGLTGQQHIASLTRIKTLDEQLSLTVQSLAQAKAKHGFLTSMSNDPARFVRRWVSSQRRDLQVLLGETTRGFGGAEDGGADEFRKGGRDSAWGGTVAKESVALWSSRRRASPSRRTAG